MSEDIRMFCPQCGQPAPSTIYGLCLKCYAKVRFLTRLKRQRRGR